MQTRGLKIESLRQAINLVNAAFPKQPFGESAWLSLPLSLAPKWSLWPPKMTHLQYWVAIDQDRVVGISGLYGWKSEPGVAWIGWTVVAPEFRRLGIGSALLDRVKHTAVLKGFHTLKVYTVPGEAVDRFYRAQGFDVVERHPDRTVYSCTLLD